MIPLTSREHRFPEGMNEIQAIHKAKEWAVRFSKGMDGSREYDLSLIVKKGDRVILNAEYDANGWNV